jgi:hypothetical protein
VLSAKLTWNLLFSNLTIAHAYLFTRCGIFVLIWANAMASIRFFYPIDKYPGRHLVHLLAGIFDIDASYTIL